jgi:hypothetical protein
MDEPTRAEVRFRGSWKGRTVSATPTQDPNVVLVVSAGKGEAVPLGRFTMESRHFTHLDTSEVSGEQVFTTEDGADTLTATLTGQFHPLSGGDLGATLACVITGGTDRLRGASGGYSFCIVASPDGSAVFVSTAQIDGTISLPCWCADGSDTPNE